MQTHWRIGGAIPSTCLLAPACWHMPLLWSPLNRCALVVPPPILLVCRYDQVLRELQDLDLSIQPGNGSPSAFLHPLLAFTGGSRGKVKRMVIVKTGYETTSNFGGEFSSKVGQHR